MDGPAAACRRQTHAQLTTRQQTKGVSDHMADALPFPPLDDFEPTRRSLHLYSQGLAVIPRAHAAPHPNWWHAALLVHPFGLETPAVKLPGGASLRLRLDLKQHRAILQTSDGRRRSIDLAAGLTGTEFGDQIIDAVAQLGLEAEYDRRRFEDDAPRLYDRDAVGRFLTALVSADRIFKEHRATLPGHCGPVQFWTHGFDLAFEWFGTRVETVEEDGELREQPAQLNLGFYPWSEPYFFSNPWPFDGDTLLNKPLPAGARWFTQGWQGALLPYQELVGDPAAENRLRGFARRVYEIAAPTLMAEG
jgi:hypothetical protein